MTNLPILNIPSFFENDLQTVLDELKADKWNVIRCAWTGAPVGTIADDEIRSALQILIHKDPLIANDKLYDSFALKWYVYSSGPAPSLRIRNDDSYLLSILKHSTWPNERLLCYFLGRLYTVLTPRVDRESTSHKMARTLILANAFDDLCEFPEDWHTSVTSEDHEDALSFKAVSILKSILPSSDWKANYPKSAQRCLDVLSRIDAIYGIPNIASAGQNGKMIGVMAGFHFDKFFEDDHADWNRLAEYVAKLEKELLESPAAVQPMGARAAVSIALARMNAIQHRAFAIDQFEKAMDKLEQRGKFGIGTRGSELIQIIRECLIADREQMSKNDRHRLESALRELLDNSRSVTAADKRLGFIHRKMNISFEAKMSKQVVTKSDSQTTKALVQSYMDKKETLPKPLATKYAELIKAGTITKVTKAKDSVNSEPVRRGRPPKKLSNIDPNVLGKLALSLQGLNVMPNTLIGFDGAALAKKIVKE